ncbi:uncharacterized protein F4812DRAFT_438619 [Daldinia caldariorum]|uniref:uncharacterized protein n=1 Tax=Daldinia caldariorum TaxID=326644 RepID=UPI0020085576|nr:uncharacterized protein F4812DRAFT_438619 [Daldinia caldariorum]KAI1465413.1 hypothetical protein F4812DRAFT_438619 [Daldinia caldariorum]
MSTSSTISSKTGAPAPAPATEKTATPATLPAPCVLNKSDPQYQIECLEKLKQHMGWILQWAAKNKKLCNSNGEAENGEEAGVVKNGRAAEVLGAAGEIAVAGKVEAARETGICDQTGTSTITGIAEKTYTFHIPDANCPTTSAIPMNARSHIPIPSHSSSKNANTSKATPGRNIYLQARNILGIKTRGPNTISHYLLDADEAAAKSVKYGEIPLEHLARPESYANQYFEIKKSRLGGYGAFAKTDLKCGQLILAEQPALKANPITLYQDIAELAPELRAAFYRMHGHKRSPEHDKRQAIFLTNAFVVRESSIVYFIAARFNHACGQVRSVNYHTTPNNNIMEFRMAKDVSAGTELTISYGPLPPANLYLMWGFRCACGGCKPLTDAQVKKLNYRDEVAEDVW